MNRNLVMKKITLLLVSFPLLFGCLPSREEKAVAIAKSEQSKILSHVDSYEPVETRIDSAYTSVYTDLDVVRAVNDLIELYAEEEKLRRQYNSAKSSAALWSDSWSAYSKEQYRQAKEEMDDYAEKLEELAKEVDMRSRSVRDRAKKHRRRPILRLEYIPPIPVYERFGYAAGLRRIDYRGRAHGTRSRIFYVG